jgi:hypothetical protein
MRHSSPEGVSGLHEEDVMKTRLTMGLEITGLAMMALACSASMAGDAQRLMGGENGCHLFMTDRECADHIAALARLSPGDERNAYLLAHRQLLREREKACACSRNIDSERAAEARRSGSQAMLRF